MSNELGFTGTQKGMTAAQKERARYYTRVLHPLRAHLGDCKGADEEMYRILRDTSPDTKLKGHPPTNPGKRAFLIYDEAAEPKDYLDRNDDIAKECDYLLATPREFEEQRRSGTWATIRRARKYRKPVTIIYPDGSIEGASWS